MGRKAGSKNKPRITVDEDYPPPIVGHTRTQGGRRPIEEIVVLQDSLEIARNRRRAQSVPAPGEYGREDGDEDLDPEQVAAAREYMSVRRGREGCDWNVRHVWGMWNPLLRARVTLATETMYRAGVNRFLLWLQTGGAYLGKLYDVQDVDDALTEWAWELYESRGGQGQWVLQCALYGVEYFVPRWKGDLKVARAALKGWKFLRPPTSHPPITWAAAVSVAVQIAEDGHPGAGIGVLVAFEGYLRATELCGLRVGDVSQVLGQGGGLEARPRLLISLQWCKTGNNQSVLIDHPVVVDLLWRWVLYVKRRTGYHSRGGFSAAARGPLLFPEVTFFRSLFMAACAYLGYSKGDVRFVPHSLRHGGATRDFLYRERSLDEIIIRGRWANLLSTRRYIQQGPAQAAAASRHIPSYQRMLNLAMAINPAAWIIIP